MSRFWLYWIHLVYWKLEWRIWRIYGCYIRPLYISNKKIHWWSYINRWKLCSSSCSIYRLCYWWRCQWEKYHNASWQKKSISLPHIFYGVKEHARTWQNVYVLIMDCRSIIWNKWRWKNCLDINFERSIKYCSREWYRFFWCSFARNQKQRSYNI